MTSDSQLPFFLSFSHLLSLHSLSSSLFRFLRVISRSRLCPRDSRCGVRRRTSISVAASRGFREPCRGIPLPPSCGVVFGRGDTSSRQWGNWEERKRKIEGMKERWKKRVERKGRTLVTAKLLSIHGRHAPNWEYASRSCSTRTDAAWTCWTGPELIFRNRSYFSSRAWSWSTTIKRAWIFLFIKFTNSDVFVTSQ